MPTYLIEPVAGMTPSVIADDFLSRADAPEGVQNQLRQTIIAFEGERQDALSAAQPIAGDWTGWRAEQMSRDDFLYRFELEVTVRVNSGLTEYEGVFEAAQATRNILDDLYGAAGHRDPPDDQLRIPGVVDR